ncbi:MAG: fibronectin type III domain-containing protein, partial [Verrucomicrobia bacterium]|nr:fibronectin type III domain-containing protein [Verrucomicrobiota bacterium]
MRTMRFFPRPIAATVTGLLALAMLSAASAAPTDDGLVFDGGDDYVTFGSAAALGSATFTIETWFKRTGAGVAAGTGTGGIEAVPLVAKGRGEADGSNKDMNFFLGIRASDNVLAADFEEGATGSSSGLNHPVAGTNGITMNTWHHAAVTYDGTRWQLYLNGVPDTGLEVGEPPRADSIQHASLASALNSTGVAEGYFAGILDEVRIWNYARSAAEIAGNMNTEIRSAEGLVGSWALGERTGITAPDSSGNNVDGTLVNGPLWVLGPAPITLVPNGAVWKYLDDGSNQGTTWTAPTFDDSGWASGPAQLGYGDGDEATVVSYGPKSDNKYITTYFRRVFSVSDASAYGSLTLNLLRDDGAVVYLNGVELARQNMPSGTVLYTTMASSTIGSPEESTFYSASVNPALLVEGDNVLAVEVHQGSATSSDLSFDLKLVGTKRIITVTLNEPAGGATDISRPPALSTTVTHMDGDPMTVTFYGRVAPPPGGPDFTLAVIPDTQYYTSELNGGKPEMFYAQTDWIIANRAARNIVFVLHEGDITQNGDLYPKEWWNATNALYRLEDPVTTGLAQGLPYAVAVGNHDQYPGGNPSGTTTNFNLYFGESHFGERDYYGGHYGENNDNHYSLFSLFTASGLEFIVISMEYDTAPDAAVLEWANTLLQSHPTRRGIILNHSLLNAVTPATWTTQGQATYNALKGNSNLFLMLCGHNHGETWRQDDYNGNTVYTVLADYQSRVNGGDGWMRYLEFSPSQNLIRVRTINPYRNTVETDTDSQFDLPYDMEVGGDPFVVLGTHENVPSGSTVSQTWPGLAPSTAYEWYVVVSDGTDTVTSARRKFTTSANLPPVVNVTSPENGATFVAPADMTVSANASDTDGTVTQVEFYQNGELLGADTASPYEFTWTAVLQGTYAITAKAYDNDGGATTSDAVTITVNEPQNLPPTVTLTSPADGATFEAPASIHLVATAADGDGTVANVEFFQGATKLGEDNSAPYELTWGNVGTGTYALTAVAHDNEGASTISAAVSITVRNPPALVRGPYVQLGTPTSIVIRWRTDCESDSRVRYGTDPYNLNLESSDPASVTEHAAALASLTPATRYYYEVGTESRWFERTDTEFFDTAPGVGATVPMRIWALGDSGAADANAAAVRDGYLSYAGSQPADTWLMLGDNAFLNGSDAEYQAALFAMYPALLPNTVLWPALGDFDTAGSADPLPSLPYFSIFDLPANGQAGGAASGTEKYYSFNRANVHFVCLDSMSSDRGDEGSMATWLQNDLAANTLRWVIAYWHHPPYSKGSHDSDTEAELQQMRANLLPILESAGVDLVLSGHSRSYERSFLIHGHYGDSSSFAVGNLVDGGDGREDGTGVYQKPPGVLGTVYVVAGSGSETAGGPLNHPAMVVSTNELGSLVLDVQDDRLDVAFVGTAGTALDHFTLLKPDAPTQTPAVPSALVATTVSGTAIDLSWTDNANNEIGFIIERSMSGGAYSEVATLGANLTAFHDSGLTDNTEYSYRVKAFNAAGLSDYSNVDSARTLLPPPAPENLTAVAGDGQVTVSWDAIDGMDVFYRLGRSSVSGGTYEFFLYGVQDTFHVDSPLENGTTYYYVVQAYNEAGDSPYSDEVSATPLPMPPAAPSDLRITAVWEDEIDLAWTDNSADEQGFKVLRSTDNENFALISTLAPNTTTWFDPVDPCTLYYYRVVAYDDDGDSAPAEVSGRPEDSVAPTISCPDDLTVGADPGACEASGVVLGTPVTGDNCGVATVGNDAPAAFALGTTTVTWTVTDSSGNTAQCTQTVTVRDTQPPTLTCPP